MRIGWFAVAASCLWRMTWAWAPPPPFTARSSGFFRNPQAPAVPVRMATSGADAAVPSEARRVCLIRGIATAGLVFAPFLSFCFLLKTVDQLCQQSQLEPSIRLAPQSKSLPSFAQRSFQVATPEQPRTQKSPAPHTSAYLLAR